MTPAEAAAEIVNALATLEGCVGRDQVSCPLDARGWEAIRVLRAALAARDAEVEGLRKERDAFESDWRAERGWRQRLDRAYMRATNAARLCAESFDAETQAAQRAQALRWCAAAESREEDEHARAEIARAEAAEAALARAVADEREACARVAWGCARVYFPTERERGWNEACAAIEKKIRDGWRGYCDACHGSGSVSDAPKGVHVNDGSDMKPCPRCGGTGALHDDRRTP